jgi:hypothetical protein
MAYIAFKEGKLRERGQSVRRDMGERIWTYREPSSCENLISASLSV